jgi:hypothetical protein
MANGPKDDIELASLVGRWKRHLRPAKISERRSDCGHTLA